MKTMMKKLSALLMAAIMVLAMSATAFAAKVENEYQDDVTISNLSEGVPTTLNLYNIIYLDRDETGNENWGVVDWADQFINLDEKNGAYVINDKDGLKKAAEAQVADKTVIEEGTEYTFEQLPIGAYIVLAADSAGTYGLMVTNTYDADGKYMASQPANVVAKVEGFITDKTAEDGFVHRGQVVPFTVTTKFPAKTNAAGEELSEFSIVDESTGIEIDQESVSVTISGHVIELPDGAIRVDVDEKTGVTTFTVDLSSFIATAEAGATVVLTYSATVVDAETYNNKAYGNSDIVEYTPDEVTGYEGNITLTKVAAEDKNKTLKGAEFNVYKNKVEEGAALYFVPTEEEGIYELALSADEEGATQTIVTNANGIVKVTGLDEGTYLFKETKAPEGYSLVNEPKEAVIDAGNGDKEVSVNIEFTNTKLSSLPSTGGIGTTIFTIGGCVIMIVAAGLYFTYRRKAK